MSDLPPLPKPPPDAELLSEEELEDLFVAMAEGDYKSALTLEHHQAHQLTMFSIARQAQLWVQLEQRTRT